MSKWEKLLAKINALSKDLRFDELRKVLEAMDLKCMRSEAAAAIIRFEKKAASLSQFLSMIRLKKSMLN